MARRSTLVTLGLAVAMTLVNVAAGNAHDGKQGEDDAATVSITLTDSGYEPATVELTAGQPARLAFRNEATSTCATSVESKELGIARTALPKGETVVVELTPQEAGEYTFACAMGMVKGTVVVKGS